MINKFDHEKYLSTEKVITYIQVNLVKQNTMIENSEEKQYRGNGLFIINHPSLFLSRIPEVFILLYLVDITFKHMPKGFYYCIYH